MIEQTMPNGFRRRIYLNGAFDRRHPDPSKNYGIHGMDLRFVLLGPKGAVQFVCYTGMQLPSVREELWRKRRTEQYDLGAPMGADIGYHAIEPQYEGQSQMDCEYTGTGKCYYDGTSLGAEGFMPTFLAGGDEAVWTMLEDRYASTFGEDAK
jgi:hypothetical protein